MHSDQELYVKNVSLFRHLPDDELAQIACRCTYRSYIAGQEIVSYLDDDNDVYFVLSGWVKAKIYSAQGKVVGFREIGPGDLFGEYSAIDNAPRSASIEAEQDCLVAVMQADDFCQLITLNPAMSKALMLHLIVQLRTLTVRVFEFSTLAVNSRVQAELLRLARNEGRDVSNQPNAVRIDEPPTHAELAARVSTHREAVSRHLSYLSRQGVVGREGSTLLITDVERLRQMVQDATGE